MTGTCSCCHEPIVDGRCPPCDRAWEANLRERAANCSKRDRHRAGSTCGACDYNGPAGREHEADVVAVRA